MSILIYRAGADCSTDWTYACGGATPCTRPCFQRPRDAEPRADDSTSTALKRITLIVIGIPRFLVAKKSEANLVP